MSASVNKATILGHLGADPEIRNLQGGGKVATLSVATNESWIDKESGQRQERTHWHRVVIFNEALIDNVVQKVLHSGCF